MRGVPWEREITCRGSQCLPKRIVYQLLQIEKVLRNHPGVVTQLHANGTNIEGSFDDVMSAVKASIGKMHAMGCMR